MLQQAECGLYCHGPQPATQAVRGDAQPQQVAARRKAQARQEAGVSWLLQLTSLYLCQRICNASFRLSMSRALLQMCDRD